MLVDISKEQVLKENSFVQKLRNKTHEEVLIHLKPKLQQKIQSYCIRSYAVKTDVIIIIIIINTKLEKT